MPLYFHGPLNFALVKCNANLILRVLICYTLNKYQFGAVLQPISMLIFLKKVEIGGRLYKRLLLFQWKYTKTPMSKF